MNKEILIPLASVLAVVGALFAGAGYIQTAINGVGLQVTTLNYQMNEQVAIINKEISAIRVQVASIEASRFNSADALLIWKEIASQQTAIAKCQERQAIIIERVNRLEVRP